MSRKKYYGSVEKKDKMFYVKRIFTGSAIIYTVVVLFLGIVISATNNGENEGAVFYSDLIFLYPLSLLISAANAVFSNTKINFWLRLVLHVSMVFGGFSLYLLTVKQYEINSIVVLTPVFAVIYALIMAVVLVLRHIKNKNEKEDSEYVGVYKGTKASAANAKDNNKNNV